MNQPASPVTAARAAISNESATIRGCREEMKHKRPDWDVVAAGMEADADLVIASRYGWAAPGTIAAAGRGIQPGPCHGPALIPSPNAALEATGT